MGAERWRARAVDGTRDLETGEYVEVREVDSLVLIVEPIEAERSAAIRAGER